MPHINVKMFSGKSHEEKEKLTDSLVQATVNSIGSKEGSISVNILEIDKEKWPKIVYKRDILNKINELSKKPEYTYSKEEIESCKSLEEVRYYIDEIDKEIINLIGEREAFVKEAAKFKKNSNEVEAPKRVEEVISKVKKLAKENNANEEIVLNIYKNMISSFIELEKNQFR